MKPTEIHERIEGFLADLQEYSGGVLSRSEDLATLLELAHCHSQQNNLERMAFLAKFSAKSRKIMERIGRNGEGYDRIAKELTASIDEISSLIALLGNLAPEAERLRISQTYLAKTQEGVTNLFSLIDDLGWYKNWTIDHRDWKLL